jgi:hypothetical protein
MNLQDFFREHQMIRMTTILSIIVLGFIGGIIGLSMLMQVHGQITTIEYTQKSNCESMAGATWDNNTSKCTIDRNLIQLRQELENSIKQLQAKQLGFDAMINYCFQHADRPNPLQDLIDKGLMSSNITGITCKDVKQISDINQNQISDLANKLNQVGIK